MILLKICNLGKAYRTYGSEWGRFASWFGLRIKSIEELWVLRRVSFEVYSGEAIGIIGQNGAGKSTLLKIITGTLKATEGQLNIHGRIAAILELGMGFNPELTGRQNAFHATSLMGFTSKQIQEVMPDIEEFADIGEYFDKPVRVYSSGMQARVAFSVATAYRPDILIVDEALSVGDAAFQRKCFRRIELFQGMGTTLLLVSHDIETVKKLCNKALFIKKGEPVAFGSAKVICDEYERYLFGGKTPNPQNKKTQSVKNLADSVVIYDSNLETTSDVIYGDGRVTITKVWLENRAGERINVILGGEGFSVNYIVEIHDSLKNMIFSTMIKTREGIAVYGTDTTLVKTPLSKFNNDSLVQVSFQFKNHLAPGIYYLNCGVRDDGGKETVFLCRRVDTLIFKVIPSQRNTVGVGLVDLESQVQVWEK